MSATLLGFITPKQIYHFYIAAETNSTEHHTRLHI